MSNYAWPVSMLEGCNVPAETMMFFQSVWDESEEKSKKLADLHNEHEILKGTCAKQERYIEELEKQICILQKTLELVDKNKPLFIVKPKKVSREELIDLQNGPVIFNTEDEHIVPVCQDRWIPVTERLPEVVDSYLVVIKAKYDYETEYEIDVDVATYNPYEKAYIDDCWNTYNDWDEGQQYLHVTHWMPLPEPPKED